jgi:adhesin transport system outer membrane protein
MSPFCKGVLTTTCIISIGTLTNAQQAISLHQALDSMESHYATLKIRQSLIQGARAYETEIKHERLPSLKLMEQVAAGTDNSLNGSNFPQGIIPSTSGGRRAVNVWDAGLNNIAIADLNWEISNFGGFKAKEDLAKSSTDVYQKNLDEEKYLLQNGVVSYYFDLLRYYYMLRFRQEAVNRISTVSQAIHSYVVNGLRPGVDSSTANAELSQARLGYIETLRQYSIIKSQLSLLTGIDTLLMVPDTTNTLLLQKLPAIGATSTVTNHPVLNLYQSIYNNNKAQEQYIKKSYRPSVWWMTSAWMRGSNINYSDVYNKDLTQGLSYSRYNYLTGFSITYDLFDQRKKRDQLNVQQYLTHASSEQYQLQLAQLQAANQQASINVAASLSKLQEIPVQLNAASQAYQQKLTLYNNGLATIVDLMNALDVLNRAEIDDAETLNQYWKALWQQAYASNQTTQFLSLLK